MKIIQENIAKDTILLNSQASALKLKLFVLFWGGGLVSYSL